MKQQGNYNSGEAQEVRQRSEFLKCVSDFSKHMRKEYIEPNDGKMSLFISACDATLEDDCVGQTQCSMGQDCLIVDGLATMMCDKDFQPKFRRARQLADDYGDIEDRRRSLHVRHRQLRATTVAFFLWVLVLIFMLVIDIVTRRNPLVVITSILLMTLTAQILHQQWRDIRRERSILRNDENERNVAKMANAMQRLFSKFRSEQGEDE